LKADNEEKLTLGGKGVPYIYNATNEKDVTKCVHRCWVYTIYMGVL